MTFWTDLERHGARAAFLDERGNSISYAELARAADSFADLPERSLLLLSLDNSIASMAAYLGALRLGHPAILTNVGDDEAQERIISRFHPYAHWSPSTGLVALNDENIPIHPELALLLSTSGSTGSTKLVRLSSQAVEANARSIVKALRISRDDRAITTLPPAYSYGLSVINSVLTTGAMTVLYNGSVIDPGFRALVEDNQVTSIAGVPYTYELLERSGFLDDLPRSVKSLTQAGGRLPAVHAMRVYDCARAAGARLSMMYGQTEATARMACLDPDDLPSHIDCIGKPIPGGRFELRDPETGKRALDRGELVYVGPNVMMGYAHEPLDLVRGPELDCLRTGDLAERLTSGNYRVTGRISRFVKLFGRRIALDEVERMLADESIQAVAAGDDALLVVAVENPESIIAAEQAIARRIALPPDQFVVIEAPAMPRLRSGKLDYQALLGAGKEARVTHQQSHPHSEFRETLSELLNRKDIHPHDSFRSLGGDSLSYVQVSMAIEDALGHLPEGWEELTVDTVESLAKERDKADRPNFRWLATDVAMRPLMMGLIVFGHVANSSIRGGALALLIIAGLTFSRFQGTKLFSDARFQIVTGFFVRFVLPYYVLLIVYAVLTPNRPGLQSILLVSNLWKDPGVITMGAFWYIEVLFHCVAASAVLFCIPKVREFASGRPWEFGLSLVALTVSLKWSLELLYPALRPDRFGTDAWAYAFALGWVIGQANTPLKRWSAIAISYASTSLVWGVTNAHTVIATGAVVALLFFPTVRMWRPLAAVTGFLAQSTLFIYLTQGIAINVVKVRLGIDWVSLNLLAAAVTGGLFYVGWKSASRKVAEWKSPGNFAEAASTGFN